jgi:3-hydroxyisobutyrate dehydrogenase-like beta-hydroxyacid dehydrogenase
MATLGFVGLGIMGRPMVARLLAAGHAVHVWNRSGVRPETVERGAKPCCSATTQQLFTACVAMGGGDWDHSAIVRPLETISGHEIGQGRRA